MTGGLNSSPPFLQLKQEPMDVDSVMNSPNLPPPTLPLSSLPPSATMGMTEEEITKARLIEGVTNKTHKNSLKGTSIKTDAYEFIIH